MRTHCDQRHEIGFPEVSRKNVHNGCEAQREQRYPDKGVGNSAVVLEVCRSTGKGGDDVDIRKIGSNDRRDGRARHPIVKAGPSDRQADKGVG